MTGGHYLAEQPLSAAYERIDGLLTERQGVLLDGGVATELQQVRSQERARQREPWGTWALFQGPVDVLEVHRRFVGERRRRDLDQHVVGAGGRGRDRRAAARDAPQPALGGGRQARACGWRARRSTRRGDRADRAAAFCINSALLDERAQGRLELLSWVWHEEPPDLVILETLEAVPDEVALETIAMVTATGLPVWVSFRRRTEGMSSVDGNVLPDSDANAFPAALGKLEGLGVRAVLVNCVPVDEVDGDPGRAARRRPRCRSAATRTSGTARATHWEFDSGVGPQEYAQMAESWKGAGAQIVGGCCGVTAKHIAELR